MTACAAAKQLPPPGWTKLAEEVNSVFSPSTRELKASALPGKWTPPSSDSDCPGLGARHDIGSPIQVYPLYENAFRAHRNQSIADNHKESAELYAEFAKVAEKNQYAWSYGSPAETAQSIGTVTKRNRMICLPCEFVDFRCFDQSVDTYRSAAHECFQHDQSCWGMHTDFNGQCTRAGHTIRPMDISSRRCRD